MTGVKRISPEEQSANLAKRLKKIEQEFKDLGGQEILKRLKREGKYDKLDRMQIAEIVSRENPEAGRKLKSYYRITEEKKELDEAIKTRKAEELVKRKEEATKKQAHEDAGKATVLKGKAKELDDSLKLLRGMRANYQEGTAMRTSIEKQIALKERQLQALTNPEKKKARKPSRSVSQPVLDEAKAKGGNVTYLEDSKGNRVYMIRAGKGSKAKTLEVMTEIKGQEVSKPIDATKVKGLLNDARRMAGNSNADFSNVIGEMNKQIEQKIEIRKIDPVKFEKVDLVPQPKLEPTKVELKITPTVRLIPKIKHNGKPSKRNFEAIELMDAKGQVFRLTKDMFKEIKKNRKNMDAEFSWDKYVEMAKEKKLPAETVASFFKKGPNAPDLGVKVAEAQQTTAGKSGNTIERSAQQAEGASQQSDVSQKQNNYPSYYDMVAAGKGR